MTSVGKTFTEYNLAIPRTQQTTKSNSNIFFQNAYTIRLALAIS